MSYHQLYVQQIEVPAEVIPWSVEVDATPSDRVFWLAKPGDIAAYLTGLNNIVGVAPDSLGDSHLVFAVTAGPWYITTPGPAEGRWRLTRPLRNGEWFPLRLKRFSKRE